MKPGDVVTLTAGGPKMTVERISELAGVGVLCVWFVPSSVANTVDWNGPFHGTFPESSLTVVKEDT